MSRTPNHPAGASDGTPNPARNPAGRPAPAPVPAAKAAPPAKQSAAPQQPAAPAPAPAPAQPAWRNRQNQVIAGSALGLVLLVALFVWRPWSPDAPRLNSDPGVIAKFAASSSMKRIAFEQQRQYMEVLDEKDKAVEKAYDEGRLSDQEYRRALQLAWYGEHLKKMDKFFAKPPTLRLAYLDAQVDKKIRKKKKNKAEPKPDDAAALTSDEIDRDDSTEAEDIRGWPGDVQQRWNEYRSAYASRKQFWKDYAKSHKGEHGKNAEARKDGKGGPETAPSPTAEAAVPGGSPGGQ